jgi:type I restriction enzyme, S subunit
VSGNGQELLQGWECPTLADVSQINPPLDRCVVSERTEVNFVPMRAVEAEGGGMINPELRNYGDVRKGYTSFLSGDVIMAKITPCMENGKTTVVPEFPGSVCFDSTEFHVVRAEIGISPKWISYFLLQHETRRAAQRAMTGGVGQMRVSAAFLETLRIPLPPTAEQSLIAGALDELFSNLDAGMAALTWAREKLKLYRASILKAAVEGALTADWRAQHPHIEPASELLKRILVERRRRWEEDQLAKSKAKGQEPPKNWKAKYKEPVAPDVTSLPPLPDGWCWVTLDQVLWQLRSGTAETSRREPTDYPVLKSSAVRHGAIDFEDLNYLQESQSSRSENFLLRGDFLITRLSGSVNYVGCSAVVGDVAAREFSIRTESSAASS